MVAIIVAIPILAFVRSLDSVSDHLYVYQAKIILWWCEESKGPIIVLKVAFYKLKTAATT